jgi:hypothetical protein
LLLLALESPSVEGLAAVGTACVAPSSITTCNSVCSNTVITTSGSGKGPVSTQPQHTLISSCCNFEATLTQSAPKTVTTHEYNFFGSNVASFDSLLWDLIASISYLSQQEVEQGKNPQKREDT